MITAPFADYHRATLERLVQEGFDKIERQAAAPSAWPAMDAKEFQTLVAAWVFLQTTKGQTP